MLQARRRHHPRPQSPGHALQGVDLFIFNEDATKIKEVQGERRAWPTGTRLVCHGLRARPCAALSAPPYPRSAAVRLAACRNPVV